MDIVLAAGGLFVYGVVWFAVVGKFYTLFNDLATIGQSDFPARKDPAVPTQEAAEAEAYQILVAEYREQSARRC
jgi:hypothetical protein